MGWRQSSRELGRPTCIENDANAAALGRSRLGAGVNSRAMLHHRQHRSGRGPCAGWAAVSGRTGRCRRDGTHHHGAQRAPMQLWEQGLPRGGRVRDGHSQARPGLPSLRGGPSPPSPVLARSPPEWWQRPPGRRSTASAILREAFEYLGTAVASALNLLDLDAVVIGGGVSQVGDVLFDTVKRKWPLATHRRQRRDVVSCQPPWAPMPGSWAPRAACREYS